MSRKKASGPNARKRLIAVPTSRLLNVAMAPDLAFEPEDDSSPGQPDSESSSPTGPGMRPGIGKTRSFDGLGFGRKGKDDQTLGFAKAPRHSGDGSINVSTDTAIHNQLIMI